MDEWQPYGFIREDGNKYYLRSLSGEEGLAYDFSVNVGDTIEIDNPFGVFPVEAIVTEIDSVFIEPANEYRKRIKIFDFQYYLVEETWIEGIGSLAGLTVSGMNLTPLTGGHAFTLLCYYEDQEIVYKTQQNSLCYYPIVGLPEDNQTGNAISFFPNPVHSKSLLIIQNPENKKYTISITNSLGQQLRATEVTTSSQIEINSTDYSQGIYFYAVFDENKLIYRGKFNVQ